MVLWPLNPNRYATVVGTVESERSKELDTLLIATGLAALAVLQLLI